MLLSIGALACAAPAQAQTSNEPRYTFVVLHTPLADALTRLIQQTRINLVFPSELVQGRRASCRIEEGAVEDVLRCILEDTGLDFVRLSSGTYVLQEAPNVDPDYVDLVGRVLDERTGEPLAYAHIVLGDADRGTITNEAGRFAFRTLMPGRYQISASYLGYRTQTDSVSLTPTPTDAITLALEAEPLLAAPVVVNGLTRRLPTRNATQTQQRELTALPTAITADALASLNTIIGVQTGDALAEVHVQGGDAGEHQFKLDGATVFAPIRVGGLIGPFSPFALRQITVRKAGFGVEHGSHLSGIIQAEHLLHGLDQEHVIAQVDALSLNARVNGNLSRLGVPTEWMIAGRLGQWDSSTGSLANQLQRWSAPDPFLFDAPFLNLPSGEPTTGSAAEDEQPLSFDPAFEEENAQQVDLVFSDIHAALHTQFSSTRSLRTSFYHGQSTLHGSVGSVLNATNVTPEDVGVPEVPEAEIDEAFSSSDRYEWRNTVGQAVYEWVWGQTTFASVGAWASQYTLTHPFDFFFTDLTPFLEEEEEEDDDDEEEENEFFEEEGFEDRNRVHEVGLKAHLYHALAARHLLTGGFEGIYTNSSFAVTMPLFTHGPDGQRIEFGALNAWRLGAFLNDRIDLSERTTLDLGTRLTYLPTHQTVYAEPRIAIRHDHMDQHGRQWIMQGAVGLYRQYLQQLDVATYQINALAPSYRFWLPLEGGVRPPQAYHVSTALLFIPSDRWHVQAEGYYKHQSHLLVIDYATLIQRADSFALSMDTFLRNATGYAYGAGLTLTHKTPKLQVEGQYEYSIARRRIANRFEGRSITVPWHAPHRLHVSAEYQLTKRFRLSLRGTHVYGRAWGFRQAYYDFFASHPLLQKIGATSFSNPGQDRLPAYIQWDAGVSFTTTLRKATLQARFYAMNIGDRNNVGDRSLQLVDVETPTLVPVDRPLTPFFPSFTLRFSR